MEVRCVRCNVFIGNGPVGFPSTDCPICEAEKDVELVRLSIFLQDRRARKYRKFVKEYDRLYPNRTKENTMNLTTKELIALAMVQNNSVDEYIDDLNKNSFVGFIINLIKRLFEGR